MSMIRVTTIVSGAGAGAERGALEAAVDLARGYGGWAPAYAPWIPAVYLERMRRSSANPKMIRRLNVQDSDGTLIVTFASELEGDLESLVAALKAQRKPAKHLHLPARGQTRVTEAVRASLREWLHKHQISVLNVGGETEDDEPGIQQATRTALVWLLEDGACWHPSTYQCQGCGESHCMECGVAFARPDGDIKTVVRWCAACPVDTLETPVVAFLADIEMAPTSMERVDVDRLIEAFYKLPDNGAGGRLHIVLDDNNWERESIEWCMSEARKIGDRPAIALAAKLLTLTDQQLRDWLGCDYCSICMKDIIFDEDGCRCPGVGLIPITTHWIHDPEYDITACGSEDGIRTVERAPVDCANCRSFFDAYPEAT